MRGSSRSAAQTRNGSTANDTGSEWSGPKTTTIATTSAVTCAAYSARLAGPVRCRQAITTGTITMVAAVWEATRLRSVGRNSAWPSTVAAVAAISPRATAPASAATSSRTKSESWVSRTR